MNLVEITLIANHDAEGYPIIKGAVVCNGVSKQISSTFNRGYLMDPLYKTLFKEIQPYEDATVVLLTNIRRFAHEIKDIENQTKKPARIIRKVMRTNNLNILANQI